MTAVILMNNWSNSHRVAILEIWIQNEPTVLVKVC